MWDNRTRQIQAMLRRERWERRKNRWIIILYVLALISYMIWILIG